MRVLIVTAGSRGDVAPFTDLGQRLRQAGHQVALSAHDGFADLLPSTDRRIATAPPNSPARSAPTTAPLPCSRSSHSSKAGPDSGPDAWSTGQRPSDHDLVVVRGLPGRASSPTPFSRRRI